MVEKLKFRGPNSQSQLVTGPEFFTHWFFIQQQVQITHMVNVMVSEALWHILWDFTFVIILWSRYKATKRFGSCPDHMEGMRQNGSSTGLWIRAAWVWLLAPPCTGSVSLGKWLILSQIQFLMCIMGRVREHFASGLCEEQVNQCP